MTEPQEAEARLIVPAPKKTNEETGIVWYEARVAPEESRVYLAAFATRDSTLAEAETVLAEDNTVRTVISDGQVRLTAEINIARAKSGDLQIEGHINGNDFRISGLEDEPESVDTTGELELGDAELRTLRQWSRLAYPLEGLAHATRQSWGCGSCLLLGAGVVLAAEGCMATAVKTGGAGCAPLLISGGTFVANCEGACA